MQEPEFVDRSAHEPFRDAVLNYWAASLPKTLSLFLSLSLALALSCSLSRRMLPCKASVQSQVSELFREALAAFGEADPLVTAADPRFGDYQCSLAWVWTLSCA